MISGLQTNAGMNQLRLNKGKQDLVTNNAVPVMSALPSDAIAFLTVSPAIDMSILRELARVYGLVINWVDGFERSGKKQQRTVDKKLRKCLLISISYCVLEDVFCFSGTIQRSFAARS